MYSDHWVSIFSSIENRAHMIARMLIAVHLRDVLRPFHRHCRRVAGHILRSYRTRLSKPTGGEFVGNGAFPFFHSRRHASNCNCASGFSAGVLIGFLLISLPPFQDCASWRCQFQLRWLMQGPPSYISWRCLWPRPKLRDSAGRCLVSLSIQLLVLFETSSQKARKYGGRAYILCSPLTVRKQECCQPARTRDCEVADRFLMG